MNVFINFMTMPEIIFRVTCATVFTSAILMKLLFLWRAGVTKEVTAVKTYQTVSRAEGHTLFFLRAILVLLWPLSIILYAFQPDLVAGFRLHLPLGLRWFGLLLGLSSLVFMWWTHASLGNNYAVELAVKEEHQLVSNGPYQLIRHPMYTATVVAGLSCALIAANGLLFACTALVALLYSTRIAYEERRLADAYGDQYTRYKKKVPQRFIPGIY